MHGATWRPPDRPEVTEPAGVAARVVATQVLDAVLHRGRSLRNELGAALPGLPDPRDRALVEAIVFAALRGRTQYDTTIALWIPRPLPKRDAVLRALLHVGLAQLHALQLPAHAAVSATVDAARTLGRAHQAGLVNALLRRAQRDGLPPGDPASLWPDWLRERIEADWPTQAERIFQASIEAAPMWLRINRARTGRDAYAERLRAAGVDVEAHPLLPDGLRLHSAAAVAALPGFDAGDVSVQDGAAQLVADALAPAPGARVLDACAAPGGKSAHLLERNPRIALTTLDIDARRLARLRDTFARLRLRGDIAFATGDAADPAIWWDGAPFDAVLLDAPCSATGIVRRQPDILLHRRPADLEALIALQARMLDALWPTLRAGGTLLYATCSILRAENAAQIAGFLLRTPDARLAVLEAQFGHDTGHGSQRLPGEDGMDGFFYARLRKG